MKTLTIIALSIISIKSTAQSPAIPSTSSVTQKAPSSSSGTGFDYVLPIDSQTHKFTYSEWVKVDGAKADELYNRAVAWLSKRNDSMENVFAVEKQKASIKSKGYAWLTITPPGGMEYNPRELTRELFYTITIAVKDGGYRFTLSNFYFHYFAKSIFSADKDSTLESVTGIKPHDTLTQRYCNQVSSTAKHFSASLKEFMSPSETAGAAKASVADNMDARVAAAGEELIKSANQYYTGLGMIVGGSLMDVIAIDVLYRSVPIAATNTSPATYGPSPWQPVLEAAGGIFIIVGTVEMIVSYSHIKKAGGILKYGTKSELQFGLTHSGGVGLSLTF